MHEIHHTEGFILQVTPLAEANSLFRIFTKNFGVVSATAQSIRKEASKLKGHVALYAHVALDIVQGKDFWRITAARTIDDLPFRLTGPAKRVYGRTLEAVGRLYHGEEPNESIYAHIQELSRILLKKELSQQEVKFLDTLSLVRILVLLGYVASSEMVDRYVQEVSLEDSLAVITEEGNKELIMISQQALKESHL